MTSPLSTEWKGVAPSGPEFGAGFRAELADLFLWRRDVRRFRTAPLPEGTIDRLFRVADLAPSVGLSQPWRFVLVQDQKRREAVRACFEHCNADALQALSGERAKLYARLKLEGMAEAPCQFAVFADPSTQQGHGLGRRTMPATVAYSAVIAVHTLWLAARAEGIGLGWVSILDTDQMADILEVSPDWILIGYFCLGYPSEQHIAPTLERDGWEFRRSSNIVAR
ncbi:MAG: 5,6-dimethylbenzimidazole synthase [Devosia sp.]|nr:5,6-dimethylbenzimidazole synthase [Devosia sp.]